VRERTTGEVGPKGEQSGRLRVKGHSGQKDDLATKNTKGHEKGIGTLAFAVRMTRIQNQTSTSQLAALLLLIPPNSGRPDFVCRFIRRRSTELQNWAEMEFGVSTWSRQSQTAAKEGSGILRDDSIVIREEAFLQRMAFCADLRSWCSNASANDSNSRAVIPSRLPTSCHFETAFSTSRRISLERCGVIRK
jgi:hypothetical protein